MLKVACLYSPCAPAYIRSGLKHVFERIGWEWRWVDLTRTPIIKFFDEFQPDIFIGETYKVDLAQIKAFKAHPNCKVALFASAWGEAVDNIDTDEFPIDLVKDEEKAAVERCLNESGKPDFVWLHLLDEDVDRVLGGWRSIGAKPIGLLNAYDVYMYPQGNFRPELACDIAFCGGYWKYKAVNLNKYMIPLCRGKYKVRIFGNQHWPVPQYFGNIADNMVPDLFASATICPNVSEPHSTEPSLSYDIVERPFKVAGSGAFCVSDKVAALEKVFGDSIPTASTPKAFHYLIEFFLREPERRLPYIEKAKKIVWEGHTYNHRVFKMLTELGLNNEAAKCLELLNGK